ncbi:hypothetical protein J6590_028647 [Homalodisca vitripennis]|nr:hypothetical protein J6590_028647 [Homalodisca vitripennis]
MLTGGPVPLDADGVPVKCELQDCDDAIPLPDSDSINIYLDENGCHFEGSGLPSRGSGIFETPLPHHNQVKYQKVDPRNNFEIQTQN